MKHFKHTISFLLFSAFLISGCSEENNTNNENLNDVFLLSLQMPSHGDATRVGVSESQGSKNLKTEWKDDDYVQVIVNRGNDMYDLGKCKVFNISKDKKQATITVDRRAFPTLLTPFKVYCFTGNTHPASADAIGGGNWSAYCTYDIIRESLESFNAPMFSQVEVNGKDIPVAQFKHFGTYEVLHLKNDTDSPISVTHQGFNCEKPWYQASTTVWFNDDYDHTKLSGEWEGDVDSPEITIEPNSYGTFVSWYIPSGYKVNNAQLIATINGKAGITSTNTFSSDVTLQRGHAYHMYATWDGEELKFGKEKNYSEYTSCPDSNHPHAIDLGLPSGTLWACCNVGASEPEDYGNYYAWGETEVKSEYYNTYIYKHQYIGSDISGTKYDAARVNWGEPWRMPSHNELNELYDDCSLEVKIVNDIRGVLVTGINGGKLFLPASGQYFYFYSILLGTQWNINYWSPNPTDGTNSLAIEFELQFSKETNNIIRSWTNDIRDCGNPIRPVYKKK